MILKSEWVTIEMLPYVRLNLLASCAVCVFSFTGIFWLGVQVAHLHNGETVGYSKLCVCTGATPKVWWEVEGGGD